MVRRDGDPAEPGPPGAEPASSATLSNLAASFPLFFFGAGCLAVSAFMLLDRTAAAIGHIPLWVPFIALGIIALVGAAVSVFAEPDEPAEVEPPKKSYRSTRRTPPRSAFELGRSPPRVVPTRPVPAAPSLGIGRRGAAPEPELSGTPIHVPGVAETKSPAPAPAIRGSSLPDDATSLLREIDLIEADLHAPRASASETTPHVAGTRTEGAEPLAAGAPALVSVATTGGGGVTGIQNRLESELPRKTARCVGCGSVILHTRNPAQCQVCGEPMCLDCIDRSLAEGKPNLCPLCGLLDSVHSRGAHAPPPTRSPAGDL